MHYSIGLNGDLDLIEKINNFVSSRFDKNKIEFYLGLEKYSIKRGNNIYFGNKNFEDNYYLSKKLGYSFNYIMNSSHINININELKSHIDYIYLLGIRNITVADINLLIFFDKYYKNKFFITISVVYGIKDINSLNSILFCKDVKRVILDQDLNRDYNLLKSLINICKMHCIEVECIGNDLCINGCKVRRSHYMAISKGLDFKCKTNTIKDILKSTWIRPEDMHIYKEIGVDYIKLSGRENKTQKHINLIRSYLEEEHKGNFLDLFVDKSSEINKKYIDNKKLDGFLLKIFKKQGFISNFTKK